MVFHPAISHMLPPTPPPTTLHCVSCTLQHHTCCPPHYTVFHAPCNITHASPPHHTTLCFMHPAISHMLPPTTLYCVSCTLQYHTCFPPPHYTVFHAPCNITHASPHHTILCFMHPATPHMLPPTTLYCVSCTLQHHTCFPPPHYTVFHAPCNTTHAAHHTTLCFMHPATPHMLPTTLHCVSCTLQHHTCPPHYTVFSCTLQHHTCFPPHYT